MGRYFGAFPAVRAYMDDTVIEARRRGYTRTAFAGSAAARAHRPQLPDPPAAERQA